VRRGDKVRKISKSALKKYMGEAYKNSDDILIDLFMEEYKFYQRLKVEVDENPLMTEYTNKAGATNLVKNPLVIERNKYVATINNLLKSLGLTPAQRKELMDGDGDDV
jgi:P27 family predicted phage terminase small subunit